MYLQKLKSECDELLGKYSFLNPISAVELRILGLNGDGTSGIRVPSCSIRWRMVKLQGIFSWFFFFGVGRANRKKDVDSCGFFFSSFVVVIVVRCNGDEESDCAVPEVPGSFTQCSAACDDLLGWGDRARGSALAQSKPTTARLQRVTWRRSRCRTASQVWTLLRFVTLRPCNWEWLNFFSLGVS